jgi:hypothetical protein
MAGSLINLVLCFQTSLTHGEREDDDNKKERNEQKYQEK